MSGAGSPDFGPTWPARAEKAPGATIAASSAAGKRRENGEEKVLRNRFIVLFSLFISCRN
jgi:hypothetical protein